MADLGRFQRGNTITLALALPTFSDDAPVATIRDPDGGVVATLELPFAGQAGPSLLFTRQVRLGALPSLGTYPVEYAYAIAGAPATASDSFTLVAGGDSGGEVVSLFYCDRPEARYVVAQLGSGRLVQGRNPHL